jgi:hypothetical protein
MPSGPRRPTSRIQQSSVPACKSTVKITIARKSTLIAESAPCVICALGYNRQGLETRPPLDSYSSVVTRRPARAGLSLWRRARTTAQWKRPADPQTGISFPPLRRVERRRLRRARGWRHRRPDFQCQRRASWAAVDVDALAFGHHEDRTPTHGYAATREAAMAAFAKSWRRE